jgi:hypothetical protein
LVYDIHYIVLLSLLEIVEVTLFLTHSDLIYGCTQSVLNVIVELRILVEADLAATITDGITFILASPSPSGKYSSFISLVKMSLRCEGLSFASPLLIHFTLEQTTKAGSSDIVQQTSTVPLRMHPECAPRGKLMHHDSSHALL